MAKNKLSHRLLNLFVVCSLFPENHLDLSVCGNLMILIQFYHWFVFIQICFQFLDRYLLVSSMIQYADRPPYWHIEFSFVVHIITRKYTLALALALTNTYKQCKNMIIAEFEANINSDTMSAVKDGSPIIWKQLAIRLSLFKQIVPKLYPIFRMCREHFAHSFSSD